MTGSQLHAAGWKNQADKGAHIQQRLGIPVGHYFFGSWSDTRADFAALFQRARGERQYVIAVLKGPFGMSVRRPINDPRPMDEFRKMDLLVVPKAEHAGLAIALNTFKDELCLRFINRLYAKLSGNLTLSEPQREMVA